MLDSKEYDRKYRKFHSERIKETHKKWYIDNIEKAKKSRKKYYKNNCEKRKEYQFQWKINNPEKAKATETRHYNKRKRNLGFEPLNDFFKDSVAHHVNRINVIYIPEKIHKSIWHCLESGKNMEKINKIAMNYI